MNYKMMSRLIGWILVAESIFELPALAISLFDGSDAAIRGFLISIAVTLAAGGGLLLLGRRAPHGFFAREGLVCVGLSWIALALFGCLPFWISGEIPHFVDALFETASGFSTTGASILADVEAMSRGLLYWRSFSHWLGGMGVLVFILAVLPATGRSNGSTVHLLRAESTGTNVGKLVSRMKQTAMVLYLLYILLTVLMAIFLLIGKMPLFDAVCTALGTAGTGGFGIRGDSIAGYSPYLQWVITVFMLLFGVNFSCYYMLLLRRFAPVFRDEELRMYGGIVLGSILLLVWNLSQNGIYATAGETVRHAAFQVGSIVTTTGFATTDFNLWPSFSKAILVCLMVVGATGGSTGGGMKCGRVLLLLKTMRRNIRQVLHPQRVEAIRIGDRVVDEREVQTTNAYLAAYAIILMGSFLVLSLDGFSFTTNFTAALSCLNNIGPGLDVVGPTGNYAGYSVLSKLVLILDMLAGRLELFPIMVLFSPKTWAKR